MFTNGHKEVRICYSVLQIIYLELSCESVGKERGKSTQLSQ